MNYYTLTNKADNTRRVFAESADEAKELAVAARLARHVDNLTVEAEREVCDFCYPRKGLAFVRLAPLPRLYFANGEPQSDRGVLHTTDECRDKL